MLLSLLKMTEGTGKETLISALVCVIHMARNLPYLSTTAIHVDMLAFVKSLLKLLSSSSTDVQEHILQAIDQISSFGGEQRRAILVDSDACEVLQELVLTASSGVTTYCLKVLQKLSQEIELAGKGGSLIAESDLKVSIINPSINRQANVKVASCIRCSSNPDY